MNDFFRFPVSGRFDGSKKLWFFESGAVFSAAFDVKPPTQVLAEAWSTSQPQ
jgi:hypothetical protein